jgi:HAMP domain-containing protein
MLKNLKMSAKLVAVLIAPVMILVALAVVGVQERQAEADEAAAVARLADLVSAASELSHELQLEAILAASVMVAEVDQDLEAEYEEQKAATDAAQGRFEAAAGRIDLGDESQEAKALTGNLESANARLRNLNVVRTSVSEKQVEVKQARSNYASTVGDLLAVSREASNNTKNPALSNQLRDLVLLGAYKGTHAQIGALLAGATRAGALTVEDGQELSLEESGEREDLLAVLFRRQTFFEEFGQSENKTLLRTTTSDSQLFEAIRSILAQRRGERLTISNSEWRTLATEHLDGVFNVEGSIVETTIEQANQLRADAEQERNLFMLGALLAVGFALGIALLVSRATTRPLRQLTDAAYELSNEKLPSLVDQLRNPQAGGTGQVRLQLDAIDISSRDEVGLLAEAFNAIQRVTIDVAEEQAGLLRKGIGDIFINLARRNQNILDRQIEFIDMLEAKEEDPDQLDNLFKLDHLATRMRRNAESLLVLAGAEPPRRRGRPVELADVIRVAIGEVEDFARIGLVSLDDVAVDGNVAVDLAHLLSEFMENATHFSPPDTQVEVMGRWTRDNEGATTYTISVSDQGIGMSSEQMAEANHLLAHPPLVGLALSRSLGFIVIGRLAERLGISVSLESAPTGGVVALVELSSSMVKTEGQQDVPILDEDLSPAASSADTINIEPYEPVAYEEPSYGPSTEVEEPPLAEPPAAYETPSGLPSRGGPIEPPAPVEEPSLAAMPSDEDFDRGLADLLGGEPPPAMVEPPVVSEPPAGLPAREVAAERPVPERDAEELAGLPSREPQPMAAAPEAAPAAAGGVTTSAGLVRRTPKERKAGAGTQSLVGGALPTAGGGSRSTTATQRSPEEVRKMLSRYRAGVKKDASAVEAKGDGD